MDVVRHQAKAQQRHLVRFDVLSEKLQVDGTIFVTAQDVLSRITALREMVWHIDSNDATQSRARTFSPS